jgi:phosphoribosylamine--glycine ligase
MVSLRHLLKAAILKRGEMRILVVGSGGREHALCWKIAASPLCDKLYCAPGNAGIAAEAECVAIAAEDVEGMVGFAKQQAIDFVVVGPEAPLVKGLADRLEAEGIATFGPSAEAAEIEGSKGFMKDLAAKYHIPTARYGRFAEASAAKAFAKTFAPPIVIKADGLASGKGVVICGSHAEAEAEIDAMLNQKKFGNASAEIVVEEFLEGEELSFFALTDGTHALPLVSAQDHKRVGDGDTGPNTGGMGAYSPAPAASKEIEAAILERIIRPTVAGMAAEGRPFKGVLFAGIMVTKDGPKLIEFNCRFGDPDIQPVLAVLDSSLSELLHAAATGALDTVAAPVFRDEAAVTVVLASAGYPESSSKGDVISGVAEAAAAGADVIHAGTALDGSGQLVTAGGRVLAVRACGADVATARTHAYAAADLISFDGLQRRSDIAAEPLGVVEGASLR